MHLGNRTRQASSARSIAQIDRRIRTHTARNSLDSLNRLSLALPSIHHHISTVLFRQRQPLIPRINPDNLQPQSLRKLHPQMP